MLIGWYRIGLMIGLRRRWERIGRVGSDLKLIWR